VLRPLYTMIEDNPDCRSEFCEWFQKKGDKDAYFMNITGLVRQHSSKMVQRSDIITCTGLLKI
jgi:hypothetical protein